MNTINIIGIIVVISIVPICTLLSPHDIKLRIGLASAELALLLLPIVCIKLHTNIPFIILGTIVIIFAICSIIYEIIYLVKNPSEYD